MIVFRLSKAPYKNDLYGLGAELVGGRWNSLGTPMVYTAASRALCTVEVAVHLPLHILPPDFWLVHIEIPDDLNCAVLDEADLLPDWKTFPHPESTKAIGDDFVLRNVAAVIKVPSAVVQDEFNFILNPRHELFHRIRIIDSEPFNFEKRLLVR